MFITACGPLPRFLIPGLTFFKFRTDEAQLLCNPASKFIAGKVNFHLSAFLPSFSEMLGKCTAPSTVSITVGAHESVRSAELFKIRHFFINC